MKKSFPYQAAEIIKERAPGFTPRLGMVLGSGLGALAEGIKNPVVIPYKDLPGFPHNINVKGYGHSLTLGQLNGTNVVCLQGRSHTYESESYEEVKTYIRTLKLIGCEILFATNASGSLHAHIQPGSLMMITDHINFQPGNPLTGPNDDDFGTRFPPMDNTYEPKLREILEACAKEENITLHEGVYVSVLGPNYETSAEIHAFRILGADAIGMSTVPEVLVARHCGLQVAVIATIANFATGLDDSPHDHNRVVAMAERASVDLIRLVNAFVKKLPDAH